MAWTGGQVGNHFSNPRRVAALFIRILPLSTTASRRLAGAITLVLVREREPPSATSAPEQPREICDPQEGIFALVWTPQWRERSRSSSAIRHLVRHVKPAHKSRRICREVPSHSNPESWSGDVFYPLDILHDTVEPLPHTQEKEAEKADDGGCIAGLAGRVRRPFAAPVPHSPPAACNQRGAGAVRLLTAVRESASACRFMSITGADSAVALQFLELTNWKLDEAVRRLGLRRHGQASRKLTAHPRR